MCPSTSRRFAADRAIVRHRRHRPTTSSTTQQGVADRFHKLGLIPKPRRRARHRLEAARRPERHQRFMPNRERTAHDRASGCYTLGHRARRSRVSSGSLHQSGRGARHDRQRNDALAQDKVVRIGFQKYGKLVLLKSKGSLDEKLKPLGYKVDLDRVSRPGHRCSKPSMSERSTSATPAKHRRSSPRRQARRWSMSPMNRRRRKAKRSSCRRTASCSRSPNSRARRSR